MEPLAKINVPVKARLDENPAVVFFSSYPSPHSRRNMKAALDEIAGWFSRDVDSLRFPWEQLRYSHVMMIRGKLADRVGTGDISPSHANNKLAALRGIMKVCWKLEMIDSDTYLRISELPNFKGSTLPKGRMLSHDEISRLFESCGSDLKGIRDAAILAVMLGAGPRREESAKIMREHYNRDSGELRIINGKGNKSRIVYLTNGWKKKVDLWLTTRGDHPGPLFFSVTRHGGQRSNDISGDAIFKIMGTLAEKAGISEFSPHDLRRTFCSEMIKVTDLSTARDLMGHSDVETTIRYDKRGDERKLEAQNKWDIPTAQSHRPASSEGDGFSC